MRPRPFALILLTIVGSVLGLLLSLKGLSARAFGTFQLSDPPWAALADRLSPGGQADLTQAGWLPVVVGTTWFGALAGLWLRHRWGRNVALILAVLSALHGGAFTGLAVACFGLGLTRPIRDWSSGRQRAEVAGPWPGSGP